MISINRREFLSAMAIAGIGRASDDRMAGIRRRQDTQPAPFANRTKYF